MKKILPLMALLFAFSACDKDENEELVQPAPCDIVQTYINNATKVIIPSGVWGTVSSMEGNCMPIVGPGSTCKHCPVKRTVKFYAYTTTANAVPTPGNNYGFYDSFSTLLVKQVDTDDEGFFQTSLLPGAYTMVVEENGKLYGCGIKDAQNAINPISFAGGGTQRVDFKMTYKAVF